MKNTTVEIEDRNGNTIMAFIVGEDSFGKLNVLDLKDCNIADIDNDYIFDTENELFRIQAND